MASLPQVSVQTVVVGAGVVGLAVARALVKANHSVVVLEQAPTFGLGISSRNSEVIHAGLYYPEGSLKARCCVEGKQLLYQYCQQNQIGYRRCGKLIVASSPDQLDELQFIQRRAEANGVSDLVMMSAQDITNKEPALHSLGGLYSPSTGIVDTHHLMQSLVHGLEQAGAMVCFNAPVEAMESLEQGLSLHVGGAEPYLIKADQVINAAGLDAENLLKKLDGFSAKHIPTFSYAKGNYFSVTGKTEFSHLVYPVPEPGGLGIHLTLDLAGQVRLGPDVEWLDCDESNQNAVWDFKVSESRAHLFKQAVARYWPAIVGREIVPAYSGIRPKLNRDKASDFMLQTRDQHGVPGLINLLGIESPGLTASLSLAKLVVNEFEFGGTEFKTIHFLPS